jgi:hypothetical protein
MRLDKIVEWSFNERATRGRSDRQFLPSWSNVAGGGARFETPCVGLPLVGGEEGHCGIRTSTDRQVQEKENLEAENLEAASLRQI